MQSKKNSTYSTKYTEDTEALERQLNQARSKPDLVNISHCKRLKHSITRHNVRGDMLTFASAV